MVNLLDRKEKDMRECEMQKERCKIFVEFVVKKLEYVLKVGNLIEIFYT